MEKDTVNKPNILLCWGYNRIGWIEIFEKIKEHFNFTYLYFYSKEEETASFTDCRKIYFNQYGSPEAIIKDIKPEKIIFMGIDSGLCAAMNIYARRKNIRTYFMMHGTATFFLEDYIAKAEQVVPPGKIEVPHVKKALKYFFTFRFLCRAAGIRRLKIIKQVFKFIRDFSRYRTSTEVFMANQYEWRYPDEYIVFCRRDTLYFAQQDNAPLSKMNIIGNAECEPYFQFVSTGAPAEKYILYLETPLAPIKSHPGDKGMITSEAYNELLLKMNEYALSKDARLLVKLHPYNYADDSFPQHKNITYLQDADKVKLIMEAYAVFGFDTSLLIGAAYFKNCCFLIRNQPSSFQEEFIKLGYAFYDIMKDEPFPDFAERDPSVLKPAEIKNIFLNSDTEKFPPLNKGSENLISLLQSSTPGTAYNDK